jgi:hypothetical protein
LFGLGQNRSCRKRGCHQEPKSDGMFHENLLWHFAGKNSKSLHLAYKQDQPSGGNIP